MKVFNRREQGYAEVSAASYSVLDAQCVVRGDITTDGTIRIDGRLEGNILRAAVVVAGTGSRISGNVTARELLVGGTIEGNILAEQRVELEETATVVGDIEADAILVHEGATVSGRIVVRRREGEGDENDGRPRGAQPATALGGA